MLETLRGVAVETLRIGASVFVMMALAELANVGLRGRLNRLLRGGQVRSLVLAAFLGVIPGCTGGFLAATLYGHGALSLGAVVAAMVATAGDEAFLLIGQDPLLAAKLFALMFGTAVSVGALTDFAVARLGLTARRECEIPTYHPGAEGTVHFLRVHLLRHILLRHLPRVLVFTIPALMLAALAEHSLSGDALPVSGAALVAGGAVWGLIPSSGPHALWVTMHGAGLVPFAALAANALSQSGHAILPLLAISLRDAVWVKLIALATGLLLGLVLLALM